MLEPQLNSGRFLILYSSLSEHNKENEIKAYEQVKQG